MKKNLKKKLVIISSLVALGLLGYIFVNDEVSDRQIKKAFLKKYPNYPSDPKWNLDINIQAATKRHAMGTAKKGVYNKGYWFATKVDENWLITDEDGKNYFGNCANFQKYNFPADMIPDCWDAERLIMVETANFARFFPGLEKSDRDKLKEAYLKYRKEKSPNDNREVFIKIDRYRDNYLLGTILIKGVENRSMSNFLAVRINDYWKVLYYGQEEPLCKDIEGYKIPTEIITQCLNE